MLFLIKGENNYAYLALKLELGIGWKWGFAHYDTLQTAVCPSSIRYSVVKIGQDRFFFLKFAILLMFKELTTMNGQKGF